VKIFCVFADNSFVGEQSPEKGVVMPEKKYIVRLSDDERQQLNELVSKGRTAAYRIKHAHILLKADVDGEQWTDEKIAATFGCHRRTVENVRLCLVTEGFDAALERKKRATPPREEIIDGRAEAQLLRIACSTAPGGRAAWTLELLAEKMVALQIVDTVSRETVRRKLKKTRLNPTCASAG